MRLQVPPHPRFHDEAAAIDAVEAIVWPTGPVCPHCGNNDASRIYAIRGPTARPGLRTCADCRKQFTFRIGTALKSRHLPMHLWLRAAHYISRTKTKNVADLRVQIHTTYKSARFVMSKLLAAKLPSNNGADQEADLHLMEKILATGALSAAETSQSAAREMEAQGELSQALKLTRSRRSTGRDQTRDWPSTKALSKER